MVVLELVLAHLLGDFVFQSNDLIHRKYKSWLGVAEHVCIITLFTVLFLFPFWNQIYMWQTASLIFGVHFVQDLLKIKYDIHFNAQKKSTIPFFLDQIFHFSLIFALAPGFNSLAPLPLPGWISNLYFSQLLTTYLIGIILFSFTYDITLYQFLRQKQKKTMEYKPDYVGMRKRLIIYSSVFVLYLLVHSSLM
jgi:hypothetical protein